MYNSKTVSDREIRDNYNEIFRIIGENVGLSKLTYETYMGLRERDTRKSNFKSILEDELKNRKNADISACIDTINSDVNREDKIEDDIDSFFKLGEKIYPKEEKAVPAPTPDRLFVVNDDDELEDKEQEIEEEVENEKREDKSDEKISITKEIAKALKRAGIVIVGTLDFISLTLLAGAITVGILSGGLTFGTVALFGALPAATLAVIFSKIIKEKKKKLTKKNRKKKNNKREVEDEEDKENTKTNTKSENKDLDFGHDLDDSPMELDFRDEMEEEKLEPDSISDPVPVEEKAKPVPEPIVVKPATETKTESDEQNPSKGQTSSLVNTMKPNFGVNENKENTPVSNNSNNNKDTNHRKMQTISEAEDVMVKINSKIENNKEFIDKANRELADIKKEIESEKNETVKSNYITRLEQDYNRLLKERDNALEEMKNISTKAHSLNESLQKLKSNDTVSKPVPRVTEHNFGEDKKIYIVNEPNSRVRESIDYTDEFENRRKK